LVGDLILNEMKAEIRISQARTDTDLKEMKEETALRPKAKIGANQERTRHQVRCLYRDSGSLVKIRGK
jgi:hypothetical protein